MFHSSDYSQLAFPLCHPTMFSSFREVNYLYVVPTYQSSYSRFCEKSRIRTYNAIITDLKSIQRLTISAIFSFQSFRLDSNQRAFRSYLQNRCNQPLCDGSLSQSIFFKQKSALSLKLLKETVQGLSCFRCPDFSLFLITSSLRPHWENRSSHVV